VFSGNCGLLGYYAASSGNFLPLFQDNVLGPIFKGLCMKVGPVDCPLNMGTVGCLEMSVRNYRYLLCNNQEVHISRLLCSRRLHYFKLNLISGLMIDTPEHPYFNFF
jgi:hypothetical protein